MPKIAKPASSRAVWNGFIRTWSRSLTATSLLSLAATAILGHCWRHRYVAWSTPGDWPIGSPSATTSPTPCSWPLWLPRSFQGGKCGHPAHGGDRRPGPHQRDPVGKGRRRRARAHGKTWGRFEGDVRFEDVRFAYEPDKPVLHGISFHAPPGTVTALVGSSGSGKSTIISLICAFHKPDFRPGTGRRY